VYRITISRFLEIRPKSVASHLWMIVSVQHYSLFYFLSFRVLTGGVLKMDTGFESGIACDIDGEKEPSYEPQCVTASDISCVNCSIECSIERLCSLILVVLMNT